MNKTKQIVQWWIDEGSQTNDVNTLSIKMGELAGYSYYFAEHVGTLHKEYIVLEHNRKIEYNADLSARIREGGKIGASEVESLLGTAEMRIAEKKAEVHFVEAKLLLRQVNAILQAMTMRMSQLKKEMDTTKNQV